MTKVCHALVASTAKAITAEAWEVLSSDDRFHREWPNVRHFVRHHWTDFIGHARASLVCMLAHKPGTENNPNGPEYLYPQHTRDAVHEALCLEGGYKAIPQTPSAAELARYGGLN